MLAEVLVGPARTGRIHTAADALRRLGLTEVPLPSDGASQLARLRAETQLKLPDCCVLLAADEAVLTFDDRLARAAEQRGLRCF
jgi:predicted nucleic acid-binding protein